MTALPAPTSAAGRRFVRPGWRDTRLWLGVALLLGSMALGAVVLADRSDRVIVLRAARDLSVGAVPADLVPVSIPADIAAAYVVPGEEVRMRLRFPVSAGDLVPRAALAPAEAAATREVTLAVEAQHAPSDLAPGDLVDLWSTPVGEMTTPRLVLADVPVAGVLADASGLQGTAAVTVSVPVDEVRSVVQAGRGAVIDLVAVPLTDQQPRGTS